LQISFLTEFVFVLFSVSGFQAPCTWLIFFSFSILVTNKVIFTDFCLWSAVIWVVSHVVVRRLWNALKKSCSSFLRLIVMTLLFYSQLTLCLWWSAVSVA